ncbi:TPA: integrase [Pseudomonas aeruginosa]
MNIVLANGMAPDAQPAELRNLSSAERDRLIVSSVKVDGAWVILSKFGDDIWVLEGQPKNINKERRCINFNKVPAAFKSMFKEVTYCYLMRGRESRKRPSAGTITQFTNQILPFFKFLQRIGVTDLSRIPRAAFSNFVFERKNTKRENGKHLTKAGIRVSFTAVEALYELSQFTNTPLTTHPWPETSALALAGMTGKNAQHKQKTTTPLMPDEVFCALFQKAADCINNANYILDIRDELDDLNVRLGSRRQGNAVTTAKRAKILERFNYKGSVLELRQEVTTIRTACHIVIAGTSGCRNHELANLQSGSHHKTYEDREIYHWMRSDSQKTDAGICDWMIPPIAVRALRVMERWASPYQRAIGWEIARRRSNDPEDPKITEAKQHEKSLFLGSVSSDGHEECRTLSIGTWNKRLQEFCDSTGVQWKVSSHQFRKKFANYVAHSKFGDLRYLKEHFKHWSLDMSLAYGIDDTWGQHFDLDLFEEIESELVEIKQNVVTNWFEADHLAGGYGQSIKRWQRDPVNLAIFKTQASMVKSVAESTAIRSNGHAWCTADDSGCVGNTLEKSRCGGCSNAVIAKEHTPIYIGLHNNLKKLLECKDLGEPGILRVKRDIARFTSLMTGMGITLED